MRSSGTCPKCGSPRLIKGARIVDRGQDSSKHDLTVEIHEKPDAVFFKRTHQGTLRAWICGHCGFTEIYASNPDELWTVSSNQENASR